MNEIRSGEFFVCKSELSSLSGKGNANEIDALDGQEIGFIEIRRVTRELEKFEKLEKKESKRNRVDVIGEISGIEKRKDFPICIKDGKGEG